MTTLPESPYSSEPPLPAPKSNLLHLILDHNPCLLLSTLSMLLGCYLLSSALDVHAGDLAKLFYLLAAINCYEISIITLGLFLIRRKNSPPTTIRDGLWLLLFQSLFLTDATFLIAETVKTSPHWGWLPNLLLLLLALAKTILIFKSLRIPLTPRTFGFLALELSLLYALPITLEHIAHSGIVAAAPMYLIWWIVGLLPILYEFLTKLLPHQPAFNIQQQIIRRTYLIVPWLLLVAHLSFFHYTYHIDFYFADLAPLFLGLAFFSLRLHLPTTALITFRVLLPLTALLLTLYDGSTLPTLHHLTPLLFTLAVVLFTYSYFISLYATLTTLTSIFLISLCYYLESQLRLFLNWLLNLTTTLLKTLLALLPTTVTGWGITTIILAFLLLALGSFISLKRTPTPD